MKNRKELEFETRATMANREDRQILLLEWLAATSIFGIVAIVLYMVFQFKPA